MESFKLIEFFITAARSIMWSYCQDLCISVCVCVLTILENENVPENEEDLKNLDALKIRNDHESKNDPRIEKMSKKRKTN